MSHAESPLLLRTAEFDQMLQCVGKEVEAFKKKELMSLEEMKNNVEKLNELTSCLDAAVTELDVSERKIGKWFKLNLFFFCL